MLTLKAGRHPLAVTLLVFFVVSGLTNIVAYSHTAGNVIQTLPEPLGRIFYFIMTVASAVAVVGIYLPGLHGPLVERSGLWMLSGLLAAYGVLVFAAAGVRALFVATFLLGFAVGCVARIIQIGRQLRKIRAAAIVTKSTDQLAR